MRSHAVYGCLLRPFRRRRIRRFAQELRASPGPRVIDVGGSPFN
jgi:hypothetical protein